MISKKANGNLVVQAKEKSFLWNWIATMLVAVVALVLADLFFGHFVKAKMAAHFEWDSWEPTVLSLWLDVTLLVAAVLVWVIASCYNIVSPKEVAVREWFGRLEKRETTNKPLTSSNGIFGTGIHIVPWFWGIKLIRIPKTMFQFPYQGDPDEDSWVISGTQLAVRSKDRQKLGIDMTVFLRVPYEDNSLLILIIESGVPYEDEAKLRSWLENGFSTHVSSVFGRYNYEEVMGGLRNKRLSKRVNDLLQAPGDLFCRNGLFDNDPATVNKEGFGEAYLRIEYVHVSGPLGKSLEQVATTKLEVETAESTAEIKNRVLNRPIELGLNEWVLGEAARMGKGAPAKPAIPATATAPEIPAVPAVSPTSDEIAGVIVELKKPGAGGKSRYEKKEEALNKLRSQDLAGGGTYNKQEIDVNSGGEPLKDSNIAALIGTIAGAGTAIAAAFTAGKASGGGGNPGKKRKNKNGGGQKPQSPRDDDDDDDEEDDLFDLKGGE